MKNILQRAVPLRHGSYYFLLLLLFMAGHARAQVKPFKYSLAVMPQYLVEKGLRVEGEMPLTGTFGKFHALLGLQYNSGEVPYFNDESTTLRRDQLKGFGIEALLKQYMGGGHWYPNNYYLAFGPAYHNFTVTYFGEQFVPRIQDGLEVLVAELTDQEMAISRYTLSFLVGGHYAIGSRFFADVHLGLAARYSSVTLPVPNARLYDDYMTNYAYSGIMFRGGFKLGILIF